MHVLITGGAGFIGSHLAEHHLAQGDQVYVVDNLGTGSMANLKPFRAHPAFRFADADIRHWSGLGEAVAWADRVYHMAAAVGVKKVLDDPVGMMATNTTATERILATIRDGRGKPEVVIASSAEVYGFNNAKHLSETADIVLPSTGSLRWTAAVAKIADEFLAFGYARRHDLKIVVARLFNTIGPNQVGDHGMVVPTFVRQAVRGAALTIHGEGKQMRTFCDVRDVVVGLDRLAACPEAWGEAVNIGSEEEISIRALAELVVQRAQSRSPLHFVSHRDVYGEDFDEVSHRRPVINKLRALTAYAPAWSLADSLDDLIERERARNLRAA